MTDQPSQPEQHRPSGAVPGLSFGPAAARYDQFRPGYPAAALRWCLSALDAPQGRAHVVDLGAGTGILTRALAQLGVEVIAVEPDRAMRGQLASASPGIEVRAGTAESIGLSDGAADAVFAGQAYHWFDPARAHPEIARVLRSGGVFAPIWNVRDESVPWIAELSRFADGYHDREGRHRDVLDRVDFGEWFGPVQQATFPHSWPMTADGIVELMTTRSYYLTATAAAQDRMREQVRELAAGLPDRFDMAYLTYAYRAIRR